MRFTESEHFEEQGKRQKELQWNLDITNSILCPGQSYSEMYRTEPRYNEFLDIHNVMNIIWKRKRKINLI